MEVFYFFFNTAVIFLELSFNPQSTRVLPLLRLCLPALLLVLSTQLPAAPELPEDPAVPPLTPTSKIHWSTQESKKTFRNKWKFEIETKKTTV